MLLKILKLPEIINCYGYKKTSIYKLIDEGLLPSQISLGARAVGFLHHEYQAVMKARIAGKSDIELKALVAELKLQRQNLH